jgi:hypothetical protein
MSPGVVPFIGGAAHRFELPEKHDESERRVALAKWITRKDNPLTWRSIVNRVWQYHFGRGLVDSPNDFGRGGSMPTHPELLDWLAVEFRDSGQSMKKLHRMIMSSAVYLQASGQAPNDKRAAIDAGNTYLWRMNRRRLTAEEIRDSILTVTGKLDKTMGGPGYRDFVLELTAHSPHYEYHKHDANDHRTHRRAIYRFIVRSQPNPWMNTLDCADPSMSVPKRDETLTALQALALLNNRFMLAMSKNFAARVKVAGSDRAAQIKTAYRLTMGRKPTADEVKDMAAYADEFALENTCRLILNLNEFVFVD